MDASQGLHVLSLRQAAAPLKVAGPGDSSSKTLPSQSLQLSSKRAKSSKFLFIVENVLKVCHFVHVIYLTGEPDFTKMQALHQC